MSCAKNSDIFLWLAVGWKGALQKTLKYTPDPGSHIQWLIIFMTIYLAFDVG